MPRSVKPWIGKTDDTPVPPRVRARVFDAKGGRCHRCDRKIPGGEKWVCEHLTAIINGGPNAEANLGVTCRTCLPIKNAADAAIKAKVAATRKAHLGIKAMKRPIPSPPKAPKRPEKPRLPPRPLYG
jgi:5-methylcytosine-specific restriction enzyme A